MKRASYFLLLIGTIGCGSSQPSAPATNEAKPAEAVVPTTDEASASICEYFSTPGIGYSNVRVEKISPPIAAPAETAAGGWVCSVTMNCNNVIGYRQQNKDWLVLMSRENGKITVKDYYHNLERVSASPLGKEWFARSGLPEPTVVDSE